MSYTFYSKLFFGFKEFRKFSLRCLKVFESSGASFKNAASKGIYLLESRDESLYRYIRYSQSFYSVFPISMLIIVLLSGKMYYLYANLLFGSINYFYVNTSKLKGI